jgi:carbamoyltransferase
MSVVLGLNCYKHDSSAALVVDGRVAAAAEEERFQRVKHYSGYPRRAIEFVLDHAGLSASDVDHVAYYMLPWLVFRENLTYSRHYLLRPGGMRFLAGQLAGALRMRRIPSTVRQHLEGLREDVGFHFVEHHRAHVWAALVCSGWDSAAVLTMDGVGERDTSLLGAVGPGGIRVLSRSRFPNSPGILYSAVTSYLGFRPDNDEYKVMGLSSYGTPRYLDLFGRMLHHDGRGHIRVDTSLADIHMGVFGPGITEEAMEVLGPPRKRGEGIEQRHMDIACSAQRALEETGLGLAGWLRERTDSRRLLVSGGVGLNCVMNGLLERESGFGEVYPLPPSHDAGTSLGAAAAVYRSEEDGPDLRTPPNMFLGSVYSKREIAGALKMAKIPFTAPEELERRVAAMVAEGRIVAVFTGRMEFGPRALGARSILADPRRPDMKDEVNRYVKHREEFRPFAPVVLRERAGEYFTGCTDSPYMIKTYPVEESKRDVVPSVTHVDGTARVQTIRREDNPFYYDVVEEFDRLTGVPVLMNTSFNVRGEPIVESPLDAIRCFFGTGIDALAMPPYLVIKPGV